MDDALHVQHADDAIDFSLIYRQPRVLALTQLFQYFVPIIVHIDADDFGARHHDVFDCRLFQIQNADQQPQHAIGQEIGRPHERIQWVQQRRVNVGGRQRQPLRVQRAVGLGRHFAKDQQHQRQCHGAECHVIFAAQAKRDESHQHGGRHVDDGAQ